MKPKYRTEANLQADFYHQCHTVHLRPYLEYTHNGCRFDCIVIEEDEIIAIVEVKRIPKAFNKQTQRQLETYRYFSDNTPIFLLTHKDEIHLIIAEIQKIRKSHKKKLKNQKLSAVDVSFI